MEKTHWKKVFDSDYLGACDIEDGKTLNAIIKGVEIKEVKGQNGEKQARNVAIFTDSKIKPMVLNATNCKLVKKFANSSYIDDWKNIPISIYVAQVKAFGDITEGLRIRETQPNFKKPELLPTNEQLWNNVVSYLKSKKGTISDVQKKYDISEANIILLTDQTIE